MNDGPSTMNDLDSVPVGTSSRNVRLSAEAIKVVKEKAREIFGKDVRVVLFGSRVYEKARGGDIDPRWSRVDMLKIKKGF
tara:strand:+ start:48 stop:287 length:240 start_codon:yes stop_codon:yes gene_type:complete